MIRRLSSSDNIRPQELINDSNQSNSTLDLIPTQHSKETKESITTYESSSAHQLEAEIFKAESWFSQLSTKEINDFMRDYDDNYDKLEKELQKSNYSIKFIENEIEKLQEPIFEEISPNNSQQLSIVLHRIDTEIAPEEQLNFTKKVSRWITTKLKILFEPIELTKEDMGSISSEISLKKKPKYKPRFTLKEKTDFSTMLNQYRKYSSYIKHLQTEHLKLSKEYQDLKQNHFIIEQLSVRQSLLNSIESLTLEVINLEEEKSNAEFIYNKNLKEIKLEIEEYRQGITVTTQKIKSSNDEVRKQIKRYEDEHASLQQKRTETRNKMPGNTEKKAMLANIFQFGATTQPKNITPVIKKQQIPPELIKQYEAEIEGYSTSILRIVKEIEIMKDSLMPEANTKPQATLYKKEKEMQSIIENFSNEQSTMAASIAQKNLIKSQTVIHIKEHKNYYYNEFKRRFNNSISTQKSFKTSLPIKTTNKEQLSELIIAFHSQFARLAPLISTLTSLAHEYCSTKNPVKIRENWLINYKKFIEATDIVMVLEQYLFYKQLDGFWELEDPNAFSLVYSDDDKEFLMRLVAIKFQQSSFNMIDRLIAATRVTEVSDSFYSFWESKIEYFDTNIYKTARSPQELEETISMFESILETIDKKSQDLATKIATQRQLSASILPGEFNHLLSGSKKMLSRDKQIN